MFRKCTYMEWKEYKAFVNTVDDFLWRQEVRQRNISTT